jgi:hypothetical protein
MGGVCQNVGSSDAQCVGAAYCGAGGTCQPKLGAGQPAGAPDQCLSSFVANGVCCTSACQAGPCAACSVAAGALMDGTCSPIDGVACNDGNACTQTDTCSGGICVGSNPKVCPAGGQCQATGMCDPASGMCLPVDLPDGSACSNDNPCSNDSCQAGVCKGVSKLDGTPCTGGICIAGKCLLDPSQLTTSSSSGGGGGGAATTATTAATTGAGGSPGMGGGGAGGAGVHALELPHLTGGGCLSVAPLGAPERAPAGGAGAAALFAGLLAALRRLGAPRGRRGGGRRA